MSTKSEDFYQMIFVLYCNTGKITLLFKLHFDFSYEDSELNISTFL